MKKIKYLVFTILVSVLFINVNALSIDSSSDLPSFGYIVGNHLLTEDKTYSNYKNNDYVPNLEYFTYAGVTNSNIQKHSDVHILYFMVYSVGEETIEYWYDVVGGEEVEAPNFPIEIDYINGVLVDEDGDEVNTDETFTVTFDDDNDETTNASQSVKYGNKAVKPTDPSIDGKVFLYWTLDGEYYNFDTPVKGDITLVASYTNAGSTEPTYSGLIELKNYNPELEVAEDEIEYSSEIMTYNTAITGSVLGLPTLEDTANYAFVGWVAEGSDEVKTTHSLLTSTDNAVYYAKYALKKMTIEFNANVPQGAELESTGDMDDQVVEGATTISANTYDVKGYTFKEWNTKADGTGTSYGNEGNINLLDSKDLTLYAIWTENKATITYNGNGGQVKETEDVEYTNSVSVDVKYTDTELPSLIKNRDYSTFVKWVVSGTEDELTLDDVKALIKDGNDTITVDATWNDTQFTISYNVNDNEDYPVTSTGDNETTVTHYTASFNLADPVRPGYTFDGWYEVVDEEEATTKTKSISGVTGNVDLIAKWTPASVVVTFAANGGTGNPITLTIDADNAGKVPANTYTKEGFDFEAWSYKNDNKTYDENLDHDDEITVKDLIDNNVLSGNGATLYAVWNSAVTNVTYNVNVPSQAVDGDIVTDTMDGDTFYSRDVYEITTVTDKADFNEKKPTLYVAGEESFVAVAEDAEYDADKTYYIKHAASVDAKLSANVFKVKGFEFKGWALSATGDVVYADKDEIDYSAASLQLYAVWEEKEYTITFNGNGGKIVVDEEEVDSFTETFSYSDCVPLKRGFAKNGYTLAGWKYGSETLGLTPVSRISDTDVELVAKWTPVTYTISYQGLDGADNSENAGIVSYTIENNDISIANPTKTGYVFDGWVVGEAAAVKNYVIAGGSTGNITLTATWTPNQYNVVFNPNAEDVEETMHKQTLTYDGGLVALTANAFTRTGYTFAGWATSVNGAVEYSNEALVSNLTTETDDVDLYAVWSPVTKTVSFELNSDDATWDLEPIDVTYGENAKALPKTGFNYTGYSFGGWYDNEDLSGDAIKEVADLTEDLTLYAKWTPVTYTISYQGLDGANNSGNAGKDSYTIEDGDISIANPTKTGYAFAGWVVGEAAAVNNYVIAGGSTGNITLVATWTPNQYNVVFNPNAEDVEGTMAKQTLTYDGGPVQLTINAFTRAGFTFLGWSLTPDGAVKYNDQGEVENLTTGTDDFNLYAKWDEK